MPHIARERDAVPRAEGRGCYCGDALTVEILHPSLTPETAPPPPPPQKTAKYVFLSVRWVLGVPVPFHNFFPKFVTNYVLTKMPYLYFLLISALQVRTPALLQTQRTCLPLSPAYDYCPPPTPCVRVLDPGCVAL